MSHADTFAECVSMAGALVRQRRFKATSTDSGRSCDVVLTCSPGDAVVAGVDKLVCSSSLVRRVASEVCTCQHRSKANGHRRCDYVVFSGDGEKTRVLLVEVKTGVSAEQRDIKEGYEQLLCSKTILDELVDQLPGDRPNMEIRGIVVTPAFNSSSRVNQAAAEWERRFRIQLRHARCGDDLWKLAFPS